MSLFTEVNRLKADLDALRPLAPEQEARVLQKFRLEWSYNSNAIEGNSLTLGETRSLLLHGLTAAGKPMRDHLDIKGHNEAVLWLEDIVRDDRQLTEQFIRGMHEVLLGEPFFTPAQTADGQPMRKMITPGQYKRQPNNVLTATGEMFYFASPEETPGRMTDLVDWYRAEEATPTMHPVALAAEFHYRFVRIHPFDDGNGRMSRLLMNLILLRHGYPMTVIQAADRNRYLAALAEADAGEPEPFLRFIIENVEAGLRLMIRAARGESIDEPSDLDKKLALLKKQVLTREDAIETVWNLKTQSQFYEALFLPWFTDAVSQMEKFDDLFLSKNISAMIDYHPQKSMSPAHSKVNTIEAAYEFAEAAFKKIETVIPEAWIVFAWEEFRVAGMAYNLGGLLAFSFNKHDFTVSFGVNITNTPLADLKRQIVYRSIYKKEYEHVPVHEINYQLANKVYDFIAAKLAEANTPPAA